ncbi:unnamed protein product [Discula destructiva]
MSPSDSSQPPPPQDMHHELRTAQSSAGYLMNAVEGCTKPAHICDCLMSVQVLAASRRHWPEPFSRKGRSSLLTKTLTSYHAPQAVADSMGVTNITFQQADFFALPFDDATFDVTHCHQVLAHLAQPAEALREMLRVTNPGGVVAAREGDLETECVWPELPGMVRFHALSAGIIKLAGGSPKADRQAFVVGTAGWHSSASDHADFRDVVLPRCIRKKDMDRSYGRTIADWAAAKCWPC